MTGVTPIQKFKEGDIESAIWKNTRKDGKNFYTFKITRYYYSDQEKTWKQTNTFTTKNIEKIQKVLSQTKEWMEKQYNDVS